MSNENYHEIERLLSSTDKEELRKGLDLIKKEIARVGSSEARPLFEMLYALFYIDPLEYPELVPLLEEAITLIVGFGSWVIPVLIDKLEAGDIKAQMAIAQALGRIGADAVEPLVNEYRMRDDASKRIFILYALGKIKSPKIIRAMEAALESCTASDLELRDTATRAVGKFIESIPAGDLQPEMKTRILKTLKANLASENPGVRSKAVRSLCKLAKFGHLNENEKKEVKSICRRLLGTDEHFEWDRAFVVRREAQEGLRYL